MVVLDQDTVLDDAFDGPPAGVHPLVPDLHALRDPERRSLLRLELLDDRHTPEVVIVCGSPVAWKM
jgi:hypothetical protein